MKKMSSKTYANTIYRAAKLHGPCSLIAKDIRDFLAKASDLRQPNDFNFQYTGVAEFRWHDGKTEYFGSSKRYIAALLSGDGAIHLRGSLAKELHSQGDKTDINSLRLDDALTILRILLSIVDAKDADGNDLSLSA